MKNQNTTTIVNKTQELNDGKITLENMQVWASKIAHSVYREVYGSTGDNKIYEMYVSQFKDSYNIDNYIVDVKKIPNGQNNKSITISDSYDGVQVACAYLYEMYLNGVTDLFEKDTVTLILKSGKEKKVTLFQGGCRAVRQYIYKHGQTDYKKMYIEDFNKEDKDGNAINCYDELHNKMQVSHYYDISNYEEYENIQELQNILYSLNLTDRQLLILHYRRQGFSISKIADKLQVKHNTISGHLATIQHKLLQKYPQYKSMVK